MYDIYDNDFDKAFDEAVDAIEKKEHRLIWADALKKHYAWWKDGGYEMTLDEAKNCFDTIVNLQPTVDPRVHAKWLDKEVTVEVMELLGCRYDDRVFECSHCRNVEMTRSNYCRRCGAYMWDEVEE